MHQSLTWQFLPPRLLQALRLGAISQVEAAELWDLALMEPGPEVYLPQRLVPAWQRMHLLLDLRPPPIRH